MLATAETRRVSKMETRNHLEGARNHLKPYLRSVADRLAVQRIDRHHVLGGNTAGDFDLVRLESEVTNRGASVVAGNQQYIGLGIVRSYGLARHHQRVGVLGDNDGDSHVDIGQQFQILVIYDAGGFADVARAE